MEYIRAIFVKNSIIDEYRRDYPETRAFIELQPVLEKLRVKVFLKFFFLKAFGN